MATVPRWVMHFCKLLLFFGVPGYLLILLTYGMDYYGVLSPARWVAYFCFAWVMAGGAFALGVFIVVVRHWAACPVCDGERFVAIPSGTNDEQDAG